jgi:phosphoglycolate phosphatase
MGWPKYLRLRVPVAAAVFDFDGTLADTRIDFSQMRRRVIDLLTRRGLWREGMDEGKYVLEIVELGAQAAAESGGDPCEIRREADLEIRRIELAAARRASLCNGAAEVLARLRNCGVRTGIITRNCAEAVDVIMSRFGLEADVVLTREHARRVKPAPEHLLQALDALKVEPERSALVGDHVTDVQCALSAGTLAVAVAGASSTPEELREAGAHYVAYSLEHAACFLLGNSNTWQTEILW